MVEVDGSATASGTGGTTPYTLHGVMLQQQQALQE